MKKLRLEALEIGVNEVLTREQLKNVRGGDYGSGTGTPGGNNGNPCASGGCQNIQGYYSDYQGQGSAWGGGPCSPQTGGSSCHNYCADGAYGGGYYGWC